MNIMIVTREQLPGPPHREFHGHDVWLRSDVSGIRALPVHIMVLAADITDEQRAAAYERVKSVKGVVIDLGAKPEDETATPVESVVNLSGHTLRTGVEVAYVREGQIAYGTVSRLTKNSRINHRYHPHIDVYLRSGCVTTMHECAVLASQGTAKTEDNGALEFLKRASDGEHRIVSSGDLTTTHIATAQAEKRFYVEPGGGFGWALVPWKNSTWKDAERAGQRPPTPVEFGGQSRP